MKKSPIKVKLLRGVFLSGTDSYMVTSITNAVNIGAFNGKIVRVGDFLTEKEAEHLTSSYVVTVTHK